MRNSFAVELSIIYEDGLALFRRHSPRRVRDMQNDDLRNRPPWSICVATTSRSDVYHSAKSSVTAVYANVRRQKSMRLRRRDASTGAVYWNRMAIELYAGSAFSRSRLQASFERMKK